MSGIGIGIGRPTFPFPSARGGDGGVSGRKSSDARQDKGQSRDRCKKAGAVNFECLSALLSISRIPLSEDAG